MADKEEITIEGVCGAESPVKDEEMAEETESMEPLARLEKEVQQLKDFSQAQAETIRQLGAMTIYNTRETKRPVITKPRDIKILELHDLEGLEAAGKLAVFFEGVEQCSQDDRDRVQIAKSRVSSELAMLLHNRQQKGSSTTWAEVKHFFRSEFAVDVNIDRAWQELEMQQYQWEDSPQAFTNRLICRYAVLESKFPGEKFPNRDKTIKRKICHGLPKNVGRKVEAYLDEDYPLNKFLDRVEHERQFLLEGSGTNKVWQTAEENPVVNTMSTPEAASAKGIETLQQQLETLNRKIEQMAQRSSQYCPRCRENTHALRNCPRRPYCPYCRQHTHSLSECTKRPPPGACFDCRQQNCRRGNPSCPGKREK